jgi:hypothetical protein
LVDIFPIVAILVSKGNSFLVLFNDFSCLYFRFSHTSDQALLAALIDRGAAVIMTFLFGLIFSRILLLGLKPSEDIAEN